MNRPEYIAETYKGRLMEYCKVNTYHIKRLTGNMIPEKDREHLARTALWLTTVENPKQSLRKILAQAKSLYLKWILEDYRGVIQEENFDRNPNRKLPLQDNPIDKTELESEVLHALDTLIIDYGIHLGMWAVMGLVLQEKQSKSLTFFKEMDVTPSELQCKQAHKIVERLRTFLREQKV